MCWRRGWTTYTGYSGNIKSPSQFVLDSFHRTYTYCYCRLYYLIFILLTTFRSSPIKYFTTELSLKGRLKRLLLRKPSTSTFLFLSIKTRLIDWFYFCHFFIVFKYFDINLLHFSMKEGWHSLRYKTMSHICLSYYYFLMNKASIDIHHLH